MHILFLCNSFPYPENDTYKHAVMQTVRALHRKGAKVTILAQITNNEAINIENIPEEVRTWADYYMVEVEQKISFLDKITCFLFSQESVEVSTYRSLGFVDELLKIMEQNPPDVVQFEGIEMAAYREDIAIDNCVLRIHGYQAPLYNAKIAATNDIVRKNYYQICQARLADWEWEQVLGGNFKRLMLYDNSFKAEITNAFLHYKGSIPPIFIPIYGMDFSPILPAENIEVEPNSVYWFGTLSLASNQKALSWFISGIWSQVFANYPQAKLYIATRHRPESFLPNIGNTQGVFWAESIPNIYDFMASKAIMVLPMQNYVGQQMKLLESMVIGNAIVASSQALQAIGPTHGEHLFIAKNQQAFVQLLSTLIEHPNIGVAMGNHAKDWVKSRLQQTKMDDRILGFYAGI